MAIKEVLIFIIAIISFSCALQKNKQTSDSGSSGDKTDYRDIYPDTWVATDAVGRTMPDIDSVGAVKMDKARTVGIFYITWHTQNHINRRDPALSDVSKIIKKNPEARLEGEYPTWGKDGSYFWGEPEMGYFLSQDEYVIRKDMSMLADAGVDVLIMDVTNAVRYWDEWEITFSTMQKMKNEGNKVPKFVFWAFNGPVITVVQNLYDEIYKKEKYKDLWFYWEGKPLLLYNTSPNLDANQSGIKHPNPHYDPMAITDTTNPHFNDPDYTEEFYKDYTTEVKEFFTKRSMWWGYYQWNGKPYIGKEDNWSFGYDLGDENVSSLNPDDLVSTHDGIKEEAAVTPAQHASTFIGKSWTRKNGEPTLNEYDMPVETYVPWLGKVVENPTAYGIYFQERWDEAINTDPKFIYINDWNEWTAGKYSVKQMLDAGMEIPDFLKCEQDKNKLKFMNRSSDFIFIDQYNAEFNRGIQPMKGGYTDNYYMQMAQNIRRYKGVRPIPKIKGIESINIDGDFNEWKNISVEYRDTRGDIFHRDHPGYGGVHYSNKSGRNDIITSKVAISENTVNFFVETSNPITSCFDNNWMLLFIDIDKDSKSGWFGYDYLINSKITDEENTTLMKYDELSQKWEVVSSLSFKYVDNKMELAVPRDILGLNGSSFEFDFKWSDNATELINPISFALNGDTAPNRRFNYRCIWEK